MPWSRRALTVAAVVASLVAGGVAEGRADRPGGQERRRPSAAMAPLTLVGGDAPRIVDAAGRQVLLRGVNVNQLNDYYQGRDDLPTVVPLTEDDFAGIAAVGFDAVRLTFSWSALEPQPGQIDAAYLDRIRQAVGWAGDHELYVVLDLHQDAWGQAVVTPPDEPCLPGFTPAIGWDGAPAWATFTDGLPTCRAQGVRELSSAVAQAFSSFWADRAGIQSRLVAVWGAVAAAFAGDPTVAGYDLLNEPHPGWTPGGTDVALVGGFYRRAVEAIRAAEAAVDGGFPHLVFFEPMITPGVSDTALSPPPGFVDDDRLVFAPHHYAESIELLPAGNPTIEDDFAASAETADRHGTTFWIGEWGFFGDPAGQRDRIGRAAALEDQHRVGSAWWVWRQACGDPHVVAEPGRRWDRPEISPSLNRYRCPPEPDPARPEGEDLGIPAPFGEVLSRAYPRAAPGLLTALVSDPATGAVVIDGDAGPGHGVIDLWVPDRGQRRPMVTGATGGQPRVRRVPGGFRIEVPVAGSYHVEVAGT